MGKNKDFHYNVRLRHRTKSNFEIGFIVAGSSIKDAHKKAVTRAIEEFPNSTAEVWEINHCEMVRQWRLF